MPDEVEKAFLILAKHKIHGMGASHITEKGKPFKLTSHLWFHYNSKMT